MPEFFDIRTLFLAGSLTSFLSAAMLFVMRPLHRRSEPAVRWGGFGLLLSSLAMMCVALRGLLPEFVSWVGPNTLGPAGMFVLYEAVRRLCHARPRPLLVAGATAAMFAFQAWLGDDPAQQAPRLLATASAQALTAALMVPLLLRRVGRDPAGPVTAAIALALAFVVANGARALWILVNGVSMSADGRYATGALQAGIAGLFVLGPMVQAMVVMSWVNGRVAAELRSLVSTDPLTGLGTRRNFFSTAREALARGLPDGRVGGLLMIDLDDFKRINDRHGHRVGDRALAHFAATLRHSLQPGDLTGRYGGEEFCALLTRSRAEDVARAAEAIRAAVAGAQFEHEGEDIALTVSIGVATTADAQEFEPLLAIADRRVYVAKSMGRDRVVASEPEQAPERRRGMDRRQGGTDEAADEAADALHGGDPPTSAALPADAPRSARAESEPAAAD
ncbi:GGDEF domain-containing protein [Quisquiliibacterium transsilvanicum]|uniref:diguanylate cyclase n=1 Tax=Quisquiliibacterium transsilvanicum TaxID=1549638 RepID=A0A7W8MA00_9BURK|nr:GGDEF domain-containing protein [Quisquiliibacterium transsilvanicum]MBB5273433.1 diguanylate cyclase (GGDEF)-like protein [Quisquiliibacterium transsilvanicum]